MLHKCNLIDLGFVGGKYTWTNKRYSRRDLIFERIDKSFANPSWLVKYPNTAVIHLPRISSDHHPILINTVGQNNRQKAYQFRFKSMWLRHQNFIPMLTDFASVPNNSSLPIPNLLSSLQKHITNWNFSSFGNVVRRKARLLCKIQSVQTNLYTHSSLLYLILNGAYCKRTNVRLKRRKTIGTSIQILTGQFMETVILSFFITM